MLVKLNLIFNVKKCWTNLSFKCFHLCRKYQNKIFCKVFKERVISKIKQGWCNTINNNCLIKRCLSNMKVI